MNGDSRMLKALRVVGVVRAPDGESALETARAALRSGLPAIEVTFTVPGAATTEETAARSRRLMEPVSR